MPQTYQQRIRALAPDQDPRHIEAIMRVGRSTLDALNDLEFGSEVDLAVDCLKLADREVFEDLARSFGL